MFEVETVLYTSLPITSPVIYGVRRGTTVQLLSLGHSVKFHMQWWQSLNPSIDDQGMLGSGDPTHLSPGRVLHLQLVPVISGTEH